MNLSGFDCEGNGLTRLVLVPVGTDWRVWERSLMNVGSQPMVTDCAGDRSDGEFVSDMTQHGPYPGLTFRF